MTQIQLSEGTIDRLDGLRVDAESYGETIAELVNIDEAGALTLSFAGDRLD